MQTPDDWPNEQEAQQMDAEAAFAWAADGGGVVGHFQIGVSYQAYLDSARQALWLVDVYGGLVKALVFGMVIAVVACAEGLQASNGAAGVGKATRNSVVISFILIIVFNYFLTIRTRKHGL